MDKLWAPWRSPYILNGIKKKKRGCVFCAALRDHQRGKETQVIEVSRYSFSILNIFPYNNGHVMVMPIRHVGDFLKLNSKELTDMMELMQRTQQSLKNVLKPEAFNVGMNLGRTAGAGIEDHLHFHIVPRWNGDTNFMPVLSEAKVISQSLESLHASLLNDIKKRNRRKRK